MTVDGRQPHLCEQCDMTDNWKQSRHYIIVIPSLSLIFRVFLYKNNSYETQEGGGVGVYTKPPGGYD